jgi:hypothetical protein
MSTPAFIGILYQKKKVELIYCHFDMYPQGGGLNLLKNFNSFEKAKEIVSLGWRDCLVPSKNSKVRFYDDEETLEFENWDYVENYMKQRPDISYLYIWNEIPNCWEFIQGPNFSLFKLTNLQQFLKLGE